MKTVIALLRGINVGGKNSLPMKELVTIMESLGARNVRTYLLTLRELAGGLH